MNNYQPEDYIQYRLQRARETISELEVLINNEYWNTAINRMYYSCYYVVSALLYKNGIEVSSHSGCRQKFGQFFVQNGRIDKELAKHFTELFEKRQKGDYADFFIFDKETVLRLYQTSIIFIQKVEELITLVS